MKSFSAAVLGCLLLSASCSKPDDVSKGDNGSGTGGSNAEVLKPGNYRSVLISIPSDVSVIRDEYCYVKVSGAAAAVAAFRASLSGSTVALQFTEGLDPQLSRSVAVEVHTPQLETVNVAGGGKTTVQAGFQDSLEGIVSGSGSLTILGGPFTALRLSIQGSGKIDAQSALAKTATAVVNGSGNMILKASDQLNARIDGSGTISYYGSPQVTVNGNGANNLIQMSGQNLQIRDMPSQ